MLAKKSPMHRRHEPGEDDDEACPISDSSSGNAEADSDEDDSNRHPPAKAKRGLEDSVRSSKTANFKSASGVAGFQT
jgi:hypothetical protein